jgi:DNA-binding PadR family transcriptional regulator
VTGLSQLGRFSEPALMILISLAESAKHGYAMQEDIAALTGERPGPGTLYGAIRRLEEQRLIEQMPEEERRKPYRLTALGAQALQAELVRLRTMASTGLRRLATA